MRYTNKEKVIELLKLIISQIELDNTDYCNFAFYERDGDPTKFEISCKLEINQIDKFQSNVPFKKRSNGSNQFIL